MQTLPLISVFALAFLVMVLCQRAAGIRQYISQDLCLPISSPTTPSQSPAPSSPRPSVELDIEVEDASDVEILQEPPLDDANSSARFPINWKLIKNSQGKLLYKYGRLGHRIRHRRQQGGDSKLSAIWLHGADLSFKPPQGEKLRYWLCSRCHLSGQHTGALLTYNSTTHIKLHLRSQHRIDEDGNTISTEPQKRQSPWDGLVMKPAQQEDHFNDSRFSSSFPDWVLKRNITFRQATHEDTRAIFGQTREDIDKLLYKSPSSLSDLILRTYELRQINIRELLLTTKSKIHISCDIWTSTNHLSLLGVVAHFLDGTNIHRTVLLGIPRLYGSHTGETIATCLLSVITRYGIADRIGCFVMDNAGNNDTMIEAIARELPEVTKRSRLRCSGHILNLIVKSILYGQGISSFAREIVGCSDKETFELWRRFGAIGKVHNTIKWIMRSDSRRQLFISYQKTDLTNDDELFAHVEKLLVTDGGVRWNSTYYMLQRALELQRAIDLFQRYYKPTQKEKEEAPYSITAITDEDWTEIRRFLKLLHPFVTATIHLQGNSEDEGFEGARGSLWEIFTWMDLLSIKLDKAIERSASDPEDSHFKSAVLCGKQKIDEYWDRMSLETPYYFAATILHPKLKLAWFKDHWRKYPLWIKRAENGMKALFQEYVADEQLDQEEDCVQTRSHRRKLPTEVVRAREKARQLGIVDSDDEDDGIHNAHLRVNEEYSTHRTKRRRVESELQRYYEEGLESDTINNPLRWWIKRSDDPGNPYPVLTRMAMDLFSVPAMSSECERVFSETKRLITDDRNRLSPKAIEASQCQKNWLHGGLVQSALRPAAI